MAVKKKGTETTSNTSHVWTLENEIKLMKAALKYKPAGIMKHFNMALIHNELANSGMRNVNVATIWEHLGQYYNLDEANNIENFIPVLDDSEFQEFSLPKKDYQDIINEMKKGISEEPSEAKDENKKVALPSNTAVSDTPKTGTKRPTRSTPGSGASSAKRRKWNIESEDSINKIIIHHTKIISLKGTFTNVTSFDNSLFYFTLVGTMASDAKKIKLDIEQLTDFGSFRVKRILNEFTDSKKMFLEGRIGKDDDSIAVLILEKPPFNSLAIQDLLKSTSLKLQFKNGN